MALTLIADRILKGKIYPAFAQHRAEPYTTGWREFGSHWPYTVPLRLQEYCEHHGAKLNIVDLSAPWPTDAMYAIGLGFFDFGIDYFELLPARVRSELSKSNVRVLFYYHEGDNPHHIKQRLDTLCVQHSLRTDCYVFVSGNTAAKDIPGFVYFNDFELWYWHRNEHVPAVAVHQHPRQYDFTVLNRLHKSWRATAMADLHRLGTLDRSYWSYCETGLIRDEENPIEIDSIDGLRADTERFLASAPYFCDDLSMADRNNHSIQQSQYFDNAYCNIVMETHFDADGSQGTFLTEKTYKPIKHGQMFFIAGPAGSLQVLREQGYRVFDGALDTSYDYDANNTHRWIKLCNAIRKAKANLPELFERVRADIEHNQRLFLELKTARVNILLEHINEPY